MLCSLLYVVSSVIVDLDADAFISLEWNQPSS